MEADQEHAPTPLAERIDRVTEVPMLVLAILYIPVFLVGYLREVSPEIRESAMVAEYFIIAAFAAELVPHQWDDDG